MVSILTTLKFLGGFLLQVITDYISDFFVTILLLSDRFVISNILDVKLLKPLPILY